MWGFSMLIAQAYGINPQEIKNSTSGLVFATLGRQIIQGGGLIMSLSTELKDDELSIGKLIKKQRKGKGLTQQALAEKTLCFSTSCIEVGKRDM